MEAPTGKWRGTHAAVQPSIHKHTSAFWRSVVQCCCLLRPEYRDWLHRSMMRTCLSVSSAAWRCAASALVVADSTPHSCMMSMLPSLSPPPAAFVSQPPRSKCQLSDGCRPTNSCRLFAVISNAWYVVLPRRMSVCTCWFTSTSKWHLLTCCSALDMHNMQVHMLHEKSVISLFAVGELTTSLLDIAHGVHAAMFLSARNPAGDHQS